MPGDDIVDPAYAERAILDKRWILDFWYQPIVGHHHHIAQRCQSMGGKTVVVARAIGPAAAIEEHDDWQGPGPGRKRRIDVQVVPGMRSIGKTPRHALDAPVLGNQSTDKIGDRHSVPLAYPTTTGRTLHWFRPAAPDLAAIYDVDIQE